VRVIRQRFTLEDAIGSLASARLKQAGVGTNCIPLGYSLLLPIGNVNCFQTLKAEAFFGLCKTAFKNNVTNFDNWVNSAPNFMPVRCARFLTEIFTQGCDWFPRLLA
jgi:hypothetical protein